MERKKILQSVLASMLALISLTVQASDPNTIYSEDKLNIAVEAKQPEIIIKLKSNPTTGYSWFLRDYNNNLLIPVKHSFVKPDQALVGAPGYELWTFRVKPAGFIVPQQTSLRFVYARPWQGADSSTQVVFRVSTQGK